MNHLTLAVRDLERSLVFYRNTLGNLNRSEGDCLYFLDPDGHQLEAHVGGLATRLVACHKAPYDGMVFFDE
ncbi:catechol 2,3-dioxygenase-like lactoylglutathione lyase family enzyme [Janthinobacterium sp. S3M3]|nr:catechol 2,3-dioxygenase-like lactoylglutathione lyase family enzyme [Janthinobacterium sp. S3T4]MBB5614689.1 catechol 2,3-dioxygenase-like lactoylglutathione lyase family enzyme [Janthinobacterium sp. S3M3]